MADWLSPGQFYPTKHTLAYSDTHAGTLPIYAAIRRLGVSREEAWQLWFVVVVAFNAFAAYRLFAALGITRVLRGPLVFASAGSSTMAWFAGTHMQMLPIFPALFAWEQAIRWFDDREPPRLFAMTGCFAWQFAAGPYSAFFALVIAFFVGVARRLTRGTKETVNPPANASAPDRVTALRARQIRWIAAVAMLLAGAALAIAVMRVYAIGMRDGHSRTVAEIVRGAPMPAYWFTTNPMNFWYPIGWPGGAKNLVEQAWLAGFIPWLMLGVALVSGWRGRHRHNAAAWMFALTGGAVLTILFFTKWTQDGTSPWIWFATHLESFRAFRVSSRVAGMLQFVFVGACGLLLTDWWSRGRTRIFATSILLLACLLAAENLTRNQPFTSVAEARARTAALVQAWQRAGDRPILAFAPGFTNQSDVWRELDAWSAALQLHRATINGYSGGMPGNYTRFAWNPTPESARMLLHSTGISEENVSLVETLGEEAEHRLGYQRLQERQLSWLADFDVQPSGWEIFSPLETFRLGDRPMHQFTPPARVRFSLPDSATQLSFDFRMRDGSYDGPGHSDGVGLTCTVQTENGVETLLVHREINPRDEKADRGTLHFELALPPGERRTFFLRVDPGPSGNNAWDWPLFGALRVK
jgi:hypothetical protein